MFFEGPEKKLELALKPGLPSLREKGQPYWDRIVQLSQAQILSCINNSACDAFLLSESSLFVHDDRIIMLTCGRTRLIDAAIHIINDIGVNNIAFLTYERKNEHFPDEQPTSFEQDAETLNRLLPGEILDFGDLEGNHIKLFSLKQPYLPDANDMTLEILMHGIGKQAEQWFCKDRPSESSREKIYQQTKIKHILPDYEIDDYFFSPEGYSLNAIKEKSYNTIHVTPQPQYSYVSFETNQVFKENITSTIEHVVNLFEPQCFDVMFFQKEQLKQNLQLPQSLKHHCLKQEKHTLACGFEVEFHHYRRA